MQESEREARKVIADEWSSWSARGRVRKAYRQMTVTPDEEVPRYRKPRKGKKKHVHKWGEWVLLRTEVRRFWSLKLHKGQPTTVYVYQRSCKKCGLKDKVGTTSPRKPPNSGDRHWYW